jgi:16S rRNA (cytosine967-C5)-methyltransferase
MIAPARVAAYRVLLAVSEGRRDLPGALADFRDPLEDERDRALATEIATGVQRSRAALDHLIGQCAAREIARLDPEVLAILRLSAYQLLHLTRVPAAAVVDDAVDLAKRAGKQSAGAFVNAVLRTLSRRRSSLRLPPRPSDPSERESVLEYFSITLSHPRWLAARWYDRLGFDAAERWLTFNNASSPLTLRANRLLTSPDELEARFTRAGIVARRGRFAPDALIVDEGNPFGESIPAGWFVVQDEASQLVSLLAGPHPGPWVLDACASPGGKTTALAAAALPHGRIVACDVRDRRMALLRRTVEHARARNVLCVQADLRAPLPFGARFDCVLVDAPCSGLGVLRRDPDIRWRREERDLAALAADQVRMLSHAAEAVSPGGRLVYATCSSEPEENEAVAGTFLERMPAFEARSAGGVHPRLPFAVIDERGHLRTRPDRHGLEAFFGAVFERRTL